MAGGCFWGVQAVFQHTKGVTAAVSGYAGGEKQTAHYEMVGTGRTGHAESVAVTFDPQQISYGKILQIYFSVAHNPTELNWQGPDVGTQYRSAIFYANDEQKRIASAYIAELDKAQVFPGPIVTKLEPLRGFYPAEDYHQDFAVLHPSYPYIVFNDLPKVENLKRLFAADYRDDAGHGDGLEQAGRIVERAAGRVLAGRRRVHGVLSRQPEHTGARTFAPCRVGDHDASLSSTAYSQRPRPEVSSL